jgi:hypothetical protein
MSAAMRAVQHVGSRQCIAAKLTLAHTVQTRLAGWLAGQPAGQPEGHEVYLLISHTQK